MGGGAELCAFNATALVHLTARISFGCVREALANSTKEMKYFIPAVRL